MAADRVFEQLERQLDDAWERLRRQASPASYRRAWAPRVDVYRDDEAYYAVVELAGVDADSVTVEVEGDQVTITGERAPATAPYAEGGECLQLEIPFGAFERHLVFPSDVDAADAKASVRDGLLTLRLPKRATTTRRVPVESEG